MAAGPEDPLARMARWDALRRRVGMRVDIGTGAGSGEGIGAGGALRELAEAARQVLDRHPEVAITITVSAPDGTASAQVVRAPEGLEVTVHGPDPGDRPAARLAELLRRDPTLLAGPAGPG